MIIEKKQKDKKRFVFNWSYFNSARAGLRYLLLTEELKGKKILVPAYIGYSTREGSGVFDPIRETKTEYVFYRLDEQLNVNVEDLKRKIKENKEHILLLIHYFGFLDENLKDIKRCARDHRMIIIEDFAQAFFTFWLDPVVDFDYGIFSLHKLFPVDSGGMVLSKEGLKNDCNKGSIKYDLFNYDMKKIIEKRMENYRHILRRFEDPTPGEIIVLRDRLDGAVPFDFPILLPDSELRDRLYFQMNEEGYGVISLYHTLIAEIDPSFAIAHEISGRILNLPVHQDAEKEDLNRMVDRMFEIIEGKGK